MLLLRAEWCQHPAAPVPVLSLHTWTHTTPRTPQTRSTGKGWDASVFPKKMPSLPPGLSLRSGVTTLTAADPMASPSHTCAGKPPALNPVGSAGLARALGTKWMMYPSSTQQCRLVTMMYGVRSSLLHLHCNPPSAFIKREEKPVCSTSITPRGGCGRIFVWSQSCFSHDTEGQKNLWAICTRILPGFKEPKSLSEVFVIISFKCCSGYKVYVNSLSDRIFPVYPLLKCLSHSSLPISKGYLQGTLIFLNIPETADDLLS